MPKTRPDFRAGEALILEHGESEWLPAVAESDPFEDQFGWSIWLHRVDDPSKRIQSSTNLIYRESTTVRRFIAISQLLSRASAALWATDPKATEFGDLLRNGSPEADAVHSAQRAYHAAWQSLNAEQPRI